MKVHEEHKARGPKVVNFSLIVVSTSRYEESKSNQTSTDMTIPLVRNILNDIDDFNLNYFEIIPDSKEIILKKLNQILQQPDVNVIIFSGGTGLSPKDITYDTIEPILEKKLDGFGELFRYLSFKEIGSSAMMSRALGGIIKDKIIFLVPGSPNAVKLALKQLIIPEVKHILYIINKVE